MYDDLNIDNIVLEVGTNQLPGLDKVDELFKQLKNSKSKSKSYQILGQIEKQLKNIFGTEFELDLDYLTEYSLNAVVIPVYNGFDNILQNEHEIKLKSIKKVYIILGARLLNDCTHKEMTAIVLHEIGHIVNHLSETLSIVRGLTYPIHKLLNIFSRVPIVNMLALPLMILTSRTLSFTSHVGEYDADKFAVQYGYGDELISIMHKYNLEYKKSKSSGFSFSRMINTMITFLTGTTHPTDEQRIRKMIKEIRSKYNRNYKSKKLQRIIDEHYS